MSVLPRPTLRRNGKYMMTTRATHYLGREDVARILAWENERFEDGFPTTMSALSRVVRDHLKSHGTDAAVYGDDIPQGDIEAADLHLKLAFAWPDDHEPVEPS
jgi:hypothetical protein